MRTKDLYERLGLQRGARKAEIERAGRRLERLHHPSLNPGDAEARARYEEIHEAIEILSDAARRKQYDRTGSLPETTPPSPPGPGAAAGAEAPADVYVTLALTFEEAATGCRKEVSYEASGPCGACGGSGCDACGSTGRIRAAHRAVVDIPAGVDAGSTVRVSRQGDARGQLVVVTSVGPHPFFRRVGNSVHCEVPVSLPEAALGARVDVPTLTGVASVRIPPGTQSGQKLRLRERGLPSLLGARGDLYVEVRVVTPAARDERVRGILRQLDAALRAAGEHPRGDLPGVGARREEP